jgi:hypothetical protein
MKKGMSCKLVEVKEVFMGIAVTEQNTYVASSNHADVAESEFAIRFGKGIMSLVTASEGRYLPIHLTGNRLCHDRIRLYPISTGH